MNYLLFSYLDLYKKLHSLDCLVHCKTDYNVCLLNMSAEDENDVYLYCSQKYISVKDITSKRQALVLDRPPVYSMDTYKKFQEKRKNNIPNVVQFLSKQYFRDNILDQFLQKVEKSVENDLINFDDVNLNNETFTIKAGSHITNTRIEILFSEAVKNIDQNKIHMNYHDIGYLQEGFDYYYNVTMPSAKYYCVMKISDRNLKFLKLTKIWSSILDDIVLHKYTNNIHEYIDDHEDQNIFRTTGFQYLRIIGDG